jgi:penicillin-binding protein 2
MKSKIFFSASRLRRLLISVYFVGVLIAWQLINIQVVSHKKYLKAAEQNRTQTIYQTAPRGRIFTADNIVIAGNLPAFSLYYIPSVHGDVTQEYVKSLSADIAQYLPLSKEDISKKVNIALKSGKDALLAENISPQKMFAISEILIYYHGLYMIEETKRYYPFGSFASHLLGYMGIIDNKSWNTRDIKKDYRLNSKIGKSGIEKRYENDLKGRDGELILEVDSVGRAKRKIRDNKWRAGSDIYTTLNFSVQQTAQTALKQSLSGKGAVVALNPQNGAVLALASSPDFDPNIFVPYNDEEPIHSQRTEIAEYNLAVQGMYPPASPFKIITAIAAAQTGRLNIEEEITCTGKIHMSGREFKDWKAHGEHINFMEGMAQSCDIYFYHLGTKTGAAHIERIERLFRLGRQTGIDLPFEKSGNIFGPSKRARSKTYWFGGDTLNLSIGQGELLVTPIQMAVFAATLANKGKIWKPYYIERVVSTDGKTTFEAKPQLISQVNLKDGVYELIWQALKNVVDNGTGRVAKVKDIDVYGKTGTAQNPHGDDHGWFVAFAAKKGGSPDLALAVLVEHGKGGAGAAAPIAREIIKSYYGIK